MGHRIPLLTACGALFWGSATACSVTDEEDDGYFYPSVVTELAELETNEAGAIHKLLTDGGETFYLTNPKAGYEAGVLYRALVGYEVTARTDTRNEAYLRSVQATLVLRDSTERPRLADPVKVVSAWRAGHYVNLMLAPRTQGGTQWWGYRVDSLRHRYDKWHLYLSLHHGQNSDPTSYTKTEYASINLTDLPDVGLLPDSLTLKVVTPDGLRAWGFSF